MKNINASLFVLFFILSLFNFTLSYGQKDSQKRGSAIYTHLVNQYDIKFYHFDLNLERTSKYVSGTVSFKALIKVNELDTFAFELHSAHTIDSIMVNGIKYTIVSRTGSEVQLKLQNPVTNGKFINVSISYHGTAPGNTNDFGDGMINLTDSYNGEKYLFTCSCPFFAHEWFPCKQDLNDLIDSVEMFVTTDTSNKAASNGLLKKVTELGNGKHRFEWKTRYPINYYLIFAAVGKYYIINSSITIPGASKPLLIQHFVYPGMQNDTNITNTLNYTSAFLINFSRLYGLYPFINEKFGVCMGPFSGGMEQQTMPVMGPIDGLLYKDFYCHEMAHQWFGDAVNIATFHDIWLSEGFAEYSEYVTYENLFPAEKLTLYNTMHNNALTDGTGNIYAEDTSSVPAIYFQYLVYFKAAGMLHMIRYELNNDTMFFNILREYYLKYKFKNVVQANFQSYLESRSGRNFTDFFNQWYYGYGYPKYKVYWNQVGNKIVIKLIQSTTSSKTTLFKINADIKITKDNGDTMVKISQTMNTQTYYYRISGNVSDVTLDPDKWILLRVTANGKDPSLSMNNEKPGDKEIEIYPNPALKKIYFKIPAGISYESINISIKDINGKLVYHQNSRNFKDNVDVSCLENGIYLVEINTPECSYKKKINVLR